MADEFVRVERTDIRISTLAGTKKADFVDTYTGVLMDVQKAWKQVEKYARKKPVSDDDKESED